MSDADRVRELWKILVMIKRDLDNHVEDSTMLELPRKTWDEAVRRAVELTPFDL